MAPRWTLAECVDGWRRAGLAGIGVTRPALERVGEREAVRILSSSGLRVASLQNLDPFDVVDPSRFDALLATTLHQLDLAAELRADCLYACTGPRGHLDWDEAADRLVEQVERLLPHLHDRGVRLAIEPIHPLRQDLSFLNTASDTVELVERVDDPAFGYVFDVWHLWWERAALELARRSAPLAFSVQVSDHKAVTMRTLDRAVPGAGVAPVAALVGALEAGGYRGLYDLEVLSDDNETRGYDETLAQSVRGFAEAAGGLEDARAR
jgi:sugar phosphate isomerase/epimerase